MNIANATAPSKLQFLYAQWRELTDVPVEDGEGGDPVIATDFLHFQHGTPVHDIWAWFEAQHSGFSVGRMQEGKLELH